MKKYYCKLALPQMKGKENKGTVMYAIWKVDGYNTSEKTKLRMADSCHSRARDMPWTKTSWICCNIIAISH